MHQHGPGCNHSHDHGSHGHGGHSHGNPFGQGAPSF